MTHRGRRHAELLGRRLEAQTTSRDAKRSQPSHGALAHRISLNDLDAGIFARSAPATLRPPRIGTTRKMAARPARSAPRARTVHAACTMGERGCSAREDDHDVVAYRPIAERTIDPRRL